MKKTIDAILNAELNADAKDFLDLVRPRLQALGIEEDDATYQDVLIAGILLEAIKGDVRAAEFIRDTVGQNPTLALRKQELRLRKDELKFRQEQANGGGDTDDGGEKRNVHIYLPDNGRFGGE